MISIKQIKSDTSGPIIYQGATHLERSSDFIWDNAIKELQINGNIKLGGDVLIYNDTFNPGNQITKVLCADGVGIYDVNLVNTYEYSLMVNSQTPTSNIQIHSTNSLFEGAVYSTDFSANFVNESLVTKRYVDSTVGGAYTFSNGITNTLGTVQLGGALTKDTVVDGATNAWSMTFSNIKQFVAGADSFNLNSLTFVDIYAVGDINMTGVNHLGTYTGSFTTVADDLTFSSTLLTLFNSATVQLTATTTIDIDSTGNLGMTAGATGMSLSTNTGGDIVINSVNNLSLVASTGNLSINLYNTSQTVTLNGADNNMIVTDAVSGKGLVYATDYSANFTPESLVSKRYVDSVAGGMPSLSTVLATGNSTGDISILSPNGFNILNVKDLNATLAWTDGASNEASFVARSISTVMYYSDVTGVHIGLITINDVGLSLNHSDQIDMTANTLVLGSLSTTAINATTSVNITSPNTNILGAFNQQKFTGGDGTIIYSDGSQAALRTEQTSGEYNLIIAEGGNGTALHASDNTGAVVNTFQMTNAGIVQTNNGSNNTFVIYDSITSKGLVYAGDYSANFTPESLVSKRYVDNAISVYTPTVGLPAVLATDGKTNNLPITSPDGYTSLQVHDGYFLATHYDLGTAVNATFKAQPGTAIMLAHNSTFSAFSEIDVTTSLIQLTSANTTVVGTFNVQGPSNLTGVFNQLSVDGTSGNQTQIMSDGISTMLYSQNNTTSQNNQVFVIEGQGVGLFVTDDFNTIASQILIYSQPQSITSDLSIDNHLIIDDQLASKGLVYTADYSANFTDNSLVHKLYVDNAIGAIAPTLSQVLSNGNTSGGANILFTAGSGIDTTLTGGTDVLNIGTSNADVINIGRSGATVNIFGTRTFVQTTDMEILDALIRLNKGGGIATGINTGFEIEENVVVTGYFKTNSTRNGWLFKAPASFEFELSTSTLTANRSFIIPDVSGTLITTGNLTDITAVGTITSGIWNGTLIGTTYGGTGTSTTFTTGSIVFAGASGVYTQDNTNFFWDDTNNRLGIKTNTPTKTLHVAGDIRFEPVSGVLLDVESATVNTTNATTTTLQTIAIPTDTVVMIDARIHSRKTGGAGVGTTGDGNAYIRTVKAKNVGGTVTIGTISSTFTSEDIAVFNATFSVSGTNVNIDVSGSANNNVTWTSSCIITR
jgi:hypothetical protein